MRTLSITSLMTGYGDIPMSVKAMKLGAVDFLLKTFRERTAGCRNGRLERDDKRREAEQQAKAVKARVDNLTAQEREVMMLVDSGLMNTQIAAQLGVTEATVKLHRGRVGEKLGVRSVAALVKMAERADLKPASSTTGLNSPRLRSSGASRTASGPTCVFILCRACGIVARTNESVPSHWSRSAAEA